MNNNSIEWDEIWIEENEIYGIQTHRLHFNLNNKFLYIIHHPINKTLPIIQYHGNWTPIKNGELILTNYNNSKSCLITTELEYGYFQFGNQIHHKKLTLEIIQSELYFPKKIMNFYS